VQCKTHQLRVIIDAAVSISALRRGGPRSLEQLQEKARQCETALD
jgi:hypothetical protein